MRQARIAATLLLVAGTAGAGIKLEPDQHYLLLAATKTSTMQKELAEAAALGFRVRLGLPAGMAEAAIFLERSATPPDTYAYKLIATTVPETTEKELNQAAAEGYRLVPQTLSPKQRLIGPPEVVSILEKPPKVEKRYEYKLLATSRTATLQKEATAAVAQGFQLVAMTTLGEHIVILEREVAVASPAAP